MRVLFNSEDTLSLELTTLLYMFACNAVTMRYLWVASVLWSVLFSHVAVVTANENYAVVVDAGSTGTRAFVYKIQIDSTGGRVVHGYSCGKERLGLSSYANSPADASHMLTTLLEKAAAIVPSKLHAQTRLYVKGTAGMRLLADESQESVWSTLVHSLQNRNDVNFKVSRKNFGTISGHQEAYYAVLASNYIVGSIDGELRQVTGTKLVGALDMGGSSNQLIIYNGTNRLEKMQASHFWSHSWLRYGAEMVRERLLKHIYDTHSAATTASAVLAAARVSNDAGIQGVEPVVAPAGNATSSQAKYLHNPCANVEYYDVYTDDYIFIGTGRAQECVSLLERLIWSEAEDIGALRENLLHSGIMHRDTIADTDANTSADAEVDLESSSATVEGIFKGAIDTDTPGLSRCVQGPCPIEDIVHPSVAGQHFYAMSVYYYALDCVRELGPEPLPHWPNPSIAELRVAADRYCALPWTVVDEQYHVHKGHAYTYTSQLPYRCLEALYIVTLLEKGFGFDKDARDITLALEVGGKEVEWTLGFVLAEVDFASHTIHADGAHEASTPPTTDHSEQHDGLTDAQRAQRDLKAALRYIALANAFVQQMESSAQELVLRCRALHAQYTDVVKQFIWWW